MKKSVSFLLLMVIVLLDSILNSVQVKAAGTTILGTNAALNSPILNSNATTEGWNKWELICWGVFLSNWCVPLLDNYESAFTTSSGNSRSSNGAGFNALAFGSGNDQENNDTIKDFVEYAVKVQAETNIKKIQVAYNKIKNNKFVDKNGHVVANPFVDPNVDDSILRDATIGDLFFKNKLEDGKTSMTEEFKSGGGNIHDPNSASVLANYSENAFFIKEANVPTFYIKDSNGKYSKILDYTNSWDIQAVSAMLNAIRQDSNDKRYSEWFTEEFKKYITDGDGGEPIGLDVFGNIVKASDRIMVLPAANNQNITETPSINVLNSWLMNNYISTVSDDKLVSELHQGIIEGSWTYQLFNQGLDGDKKYSFLQALSGSDKNTIGSYGMFYYDSDSVYQNMVDSGGVPKYGEVLNNLFSCDINDKKGKYPLKFEVASTTNYKNKGFWELNEALCTELMAAGIPNINNSNQGKVQPEVLSNIILPDGQPTNIYRDNALAVPVQVVSESHDKGDKVGNAMRHFVNWMYQVYKGQIQNTIQGTVSKSILTSSLQDVETPVGMYDLLENSGGGLLKYFHASNPEYENFDNSSLDAGNDEHFNGNTARVVVVYPTSNVMKAVSQVLGVTDGAEFDVYSTMLYMTYLDWYGVINKTTIDMGVEKNSRFNKSIFDENSDILKVDPTKITKNLKSKDEQKNEIVNYTYLLLNPKEGREYRKKMVYNGISDFVYEQYNRIVFGGANGEYGGASTRSTTGFLAVPSYQENFLTAFVIDKYSKIIVVIMGMSVLIVILFGLLKGKKLSWYVVSVALMVNTLLILPSSGEITPYITSTLVNKIFSSKMTFWTLSEGIANSDLEHSAYTGDGTLSGLSDSEEQTVLKLINQLSAVYTDRSLMFKQDISQKITQKLGGVYSNIQSIQSARWVLPMLMQQFSSTSSEDKEKYVYVKLSNVWSDASNLYWYYNYDDATSVSKRTLTSQQFLSSQTNNGAGSDTSANTVERSAKDRGIGVNTLKYENAKTYFGDYTEPDLSRAGGVNYHNYSYTINSDNNDNVHLYMWLLHNQNLGMGNIKRGNSLGKGRSTDNWEKFIETTKGSLNKATWDTAVQDTDDDEAKKYRYENIAEGYDRTDAGTLEDVYGYFKSTESPYYYIFSVVKDTFRNNISLGGVVGQLQGQIKEGENGEKVRANFMYATKTSSMEEDNGYGVSNGDVKYTPYIRDILDLQFMFNNVIPYMYEMTLASGGYDGVSGILGDEEMSEDLAYYKGTKKSWAYRCNWATKLMENPKYTKAQNIGLADGSIVQVINPMLPDSYKDAGRDMVFSRAQMEALGLKDKDLSTVELHCIKINEDVARDWTLLINYASTTGLTKEVLFKVMASNALTTFAKEFSGNGLTDTKYEIYPQSIDLRRLSFDAVMKMLLMNATRNTSYAYGSSVENVVNSEGMISQIFLLLDAGLGAEINHLLQSIVLALILFLAVYATSKALIAGNEYKTKIAGATLIQNLTFMIYTIFYYGGIAIYMSATANDEVLSVNSMKTSTGSPAITLILLFVWSLAYAGLLVAQIWFLIVNREDMGAERIGFALSTIRSTMGEKIGGLGMGLKNLFGREDSGYSGRGTSKIESISGSGASEEKYQKVVVTNNDNRGTSTVIDNKQELNVDAQTIQNYGFDSMSFSSNTKVEDRTSSADIDKQIKIGENIKDSEVITDVVKNEAHK